MAWQLINSVVKAITGDNTIVQSVGYLVGSGSKEYGYYCFHRGPYHSNRPFIAQEFCPHIDFDGYSYHLTGFLFNNKPVFKNDSIRSYIFYSAKESAWIGGLQSLREPYYYTDLDGTTVKGDVFYKGTFPELNDDPINWTRAGSTESTSWPETKEVEMKQDFWEWYTNGSITQSNSGLCGKYKNAEDGTWKYVGIPQFQITVQQGQPCYYTGEKFTRSWVKTDDRYTYEGDNGHIIRYQNGKWVLGTEGQGKWSECFQDPSLINTISFTGYEADEGTGTPVPDAQGNFDFNWYGMVLGSEKREVLMGEVSLWRSEIE